MKISSLCVFCGSSFGNNDIYREKAAALGKYLAENEITLVYGGGGVGLMGLIAETVLAGGGKVIGVIPELINRKVRHLPITKTIVTADMHERKKTMYEISDAFTAMPGGIGTLEEISEVYTWQQLGYHSKAVSLYNISGFYDNLLSFFDTASGEGFIKGIHRERLIVDSDPSSLIEKLENYDGMTIDKWS